MNVRMFCLMDLSPVGRMAFRYVKAFSRILPANALRIISAGGQGVNLSMDTNWSSGPDDAAKVWATVSQYMNTPLLDPYVNVVCCDPSQWHRCYVAPQVERRIRMGGDEPDKVYMQDSGCRKNILVLPTKPVIEGVTIEDGWTVLVAAPPPDPELAKILQYD